MNSASVHASTHQRLGGDYLDGNNVNNWNIGSASIFIWGVGLLPFKDCFLSNTTQTAPKHANTGTGSGGFKGFHEAAPELHAISAILSTGPVSPSDGLGGADIGLLMSLCRSDGLLLKPDKPARTIDAYWLGTVFTNTKSSSNSSTGEHIAPVGKALWTTAVVHGGLTWGYVLAAETSTDWRGTPATLNLPGGSNASAGVTWLRPKHTSSGGGGGDGSLSGAAERERVYGIGDAQRLDPAAIQLSPFSAAAPLVVSATGTSYGDFALHCTAPTLSNGMYLLGELAKVVSMAAARFREVTATSAAAQHSGGPAEAAASITVRLAGVAGEKVEVYYAKSATSPVTSAVCTIGDAGSCTLVLK